MSQLNPFYDYRKRGYLLPPGCKDLIDVLKRPEPPAMRLGQTDGEFATDEAAHSEEMMSEIALPDEILVRELARLTGHKPFRIIAVLMKWGIFANSQQSVDFKTASKVLRYFGYTPVKVV